MAYEYTTVTVDLTAGGSSGAAGVIYAELFHALTLANNDTVAPQVYSATVTAGAASLVLPCTATAILNTNAPFLVTFIPTGGKRRTLGRIITTESATAVQLADLLEVGGSSAVPVSTYNIEATNLVTASSIANLQAMREMEDRARVLVQDVGIYRYDDDSTTTANETTVVTPASAVGRWLLEIAAGDGLDTYDIRHYGATTGASDNATYINDAITAANAAGGGIVFVPAGTWVCNTQIVLKDKVTLAGAGRASHLDFSAATGISNADDCIIAAGTVAATSVDFSAAITKGDSAITFPSAPTGVAAGSIILIYSTDSWSAADADFHKGEFCRVRSVSAGTVTLDGQTFDSYNADADDTAYLVTPITAVVRDLRATFKANLTGIRFTYGHKCLAENLDMSGSDESQVNFNRCFDFQARNVQAFDVGAVATTNYGIVISNSQRGLIDGCHLDTTRHGLAMGSGNTPSAVGSVSCRDILVTGCILNSQTAGVTAADCHGNGEFVVFRNNQILSGIQVGGDHNTIEDNLIRTCEATAAKSVGIALIDLLGPNTVIARNHIIVTEDLTGTGSAAISVARNNNEYSGFARAGTLSIVDNHIDFGAFSGHGISCRNTYALAAAGAIDLSIKRNTIQGDGVSTNRLGVYVLGDTTHGFKTVVIEDNHLVGATIYTDGTGAGYMSVSRNTVLRAADRGIRMEQGSGYHTTYQTEEEIIVVEDNRVYRPKRGGILIQGVATTRTFTHARRNQVTGVGADGTGSTANNYGIQVKNATVATVEGNAWGKMPNDTTGLMSRNLIADTVITLYERNNTVVGTVGSVSTTGNTTNTSTTVSNLASLTGLYIGQRVSGSGITDGTTISSINSGSSALTLSAAATATAAGVTLTFWDVPATMTTVTNRLMDQAFNYNITGAAAANILTVIVPRRCIIPAGATGSFAKGSANVDTTHNYDVQVNGVSKGTIVWNQTTELATFTWATDTILAAGDRLTVHPTTDATLVNVGISLAAFTY